MDGIERVKRAIAAAGGYEFCELHKSFLYFGSAPCSYLHTELQRGYFVCPEHGKIHTPDEQAWYC